MSGAIARADVRAHVSSALVRRFRPLRFACELLAREAGRTPRATRNWLEDLNLPDTVSLIELMAASNRFADEINAIVAARRATREEDGCPGFD